MVGAGCKAAGGGHTRAHKPQPTSTGHDPPTRATKMMPRKPGGTTHTHTTDTDTLVSPLPQPCARCDEPSATAHRTPAHGDELTDAVRQARPHPRTGGQAGAPADKGDGAHQQRPVRTQHGPGRRRRHKHRGHSSHRPLPPSPRTTTLRLPRRNLSLPPWLPLQNQEIDLIAPTPTRKNA